MDDATALETAALSQKDEYDLQLFTFICFTPPFCSLNFLTVTPLLDRNCDSNEEDRNLADRNIVCSPFCQERRGTQQQRRGLKWEVGEQFDLQN